MEHTPPYLKLSPGESVVDHFDPALKITFPDTAKYEFIEYEGELYIRLQGSIRTVSVKAKNVEEFLAKYKQK